MRSNTFGYARPGFVGRLGLLLFFPVVFGCGVGQSKVSGRVLYHGEPLPGGLVTFRPADPAQNSVSAEVDEKGNYETVLPAGEVKVSIDNRYLEPPAPRSRAVPQGLPPELMKAIAKANSKPEPAAPKAEENAAPKPTSGKYIQIPSKYYDSQTSGLDFKVERGGQTHDLELTKEGR